MARKRSDVLVRPPRGTRPANRRELILNAAADLFYRDGYTNVAMKDIAEAVAIGPSALYRHFRNKHELLEVVVSDALAIMERRLDDVDEDPTIDFADTFAAAMLDHRRVGALWHREARHLPDDARSRLRQRLRRIGLRLAEFLKDRHPALEDNQADLLAWCVLGVATSVSFHRLELPAERLQGLLTDMISSTMSAAIPLLRPDPIGRNGARTPWASSRREAILAAAVKLFAERGFSSVGIEDIGIAVGIAGPSIYHHFTGKAEILGEALMRGNDMLQADMYRELGRAAGPADGLHRLIRSYTAFAFEQVDIVRLLRSEREDLLPDQRESRAAKLSYIAEWAQLLRQIHPEWDQVAALIRVHAVLNMIGDVAAVRHLRAVANAPDVTGQICAHVLRAESPGAVGGDSLH